MPTHTVNGCYNASDGSVEFEDTETGCTDATITGCYVTSGEHTGEIKITHDYDGCETQYYACYETDTGKFSYEADDECCDCCPGCDCEDKHQYIKLTIEGVLDCGSGDCAGVNLNGVYVLEFNDLQGDCIWQNDQPTYRYRVNLTFGPETRVVVIKGAGSLPVCFAHEDTPQCDIPNNGVNDFDLGDCGGNIRGYNGNATWLFSDALGNPV